MKYYLLKLTYLLLVYLIIFLFLFFYSLAQNYFYPNKESNKFIFLKKLYENQTYYLKDLISDAPFLLKWLSYFFIWKFTFVYSVIFIIFLAVKPIQFAVIIVYCPFYFCYLTYRFFNKKEVKYDGFVKHNTSFKDMIYLLFFFIPVAYLFNRFYSILKVIYNSEKKVRLNTGDVLHLTIHVSYRLFYKILLGLPLWNFYLIHQITYDILESYEKYFEDEKKKSAPILTKIKYTLIGSHQRSYIYTALRSRIYFVKGGSGPHFNPTKKVLHFIEANESAFTLKTGLTSSKRFKNGYAKHTLAEDDVTTTLLKENNADFTLAPLFTNSLLPGQSGFFFRKYIPNYDEATGKIVGKKWFNQYVCTNNCILSNAIKDGKTSKFIRYTHEMQQCEDNTHLHRLVSNNGIVLQGYNQPVMVFGEGKNFYKTLLKYGIQNENSSMIAIATKQIEMEREALEHITSTKLVENLLFDNNLTNKVILLWDVPLLPSKNENTIIAAYENQLNNRNLKELRIKTTDLDYINNFINETNAETWEKYEYNKDYQDLFNFKKI